MKINKREHFIILFDLISLTFSIVYFTYLMLKKCDEWMQSSGQMKVQGFHYSIASLHLIYFNFIGLPNSVAIKPQAVNIKLNLLNYQDRLVAS